MLSLAHSCVMVAINQLIDLIRLWCMSVSLNLHAKGLASKKSWIASQLLWRVSCIQITWTRQTGVGITTSLTALKINTLERHTHKWRVQCALWRAKYDMEGGSATSQACAHKPARTVPHTAYACELSSSLSRDKPPLVLLICAYRSQLLGVRKRALTYSFSRRFFRTPVRESYTSPHPFSSSLFGMYTP